MTRFSKFIFPAIAACGLILAGGLNAAASESLYKRKYLDSGSSALLGKERARIATFRDREKYRKPVVECGAQVGAQAPL